MYQPKIRLNFNSLISGLLVVALFAPIVGGQTPASKENDPTKRLDRINELLRSRGMPPGSKLDRETINEQIRAGREARQNRERPRIPHLKGVGPLREGVAPAQKSPLITNQEVRGQNVPPRTIVVTSTADYGPGSLRQALVDVSNGGTINITARGTIALISGELVVNKSVSIRGPGAANLRVVSGNGASRVFHITPGTTVTISELTITNGSASSLGDFPLNAGGGINNDHANLTISSCIVRGNSAYAGGGIFSNSKGREPVELRSSDTAAA